MTAVPFYLFLAVLVLAPLPLGSNREWSWTLLAVAMGGIAGLWALTALAAPRRVSLALPPWLIIVFLGVCAWGALQLWPGMPADWHHPLWRLTGEALGEPLPGRISLAPDDGVTALLRLVTYALAFFVAFQLCRDPLRAKRLFQCLAALGLVLSVYGLAIYWSGSERFLWYWTLDPSDALRGTFVNRNHFATWLGLCILCLVALFYQALAVQRRNPAYELPGQHDLRLEAFLVRAWLPLGALIVMTAALILTHSRGGFLSTLAGGVVLLLSLNQRRRIGTRRSRWVLASALAVALAAFFITNEVLLERLDQSTAGMEERLSAYDLAVDGVEDNPLLGFGYGTFGDSFRLYRDESLAGFYDRAHNTYLENIFELGWPAAGALFLCVAWLALVCLRGVRERGRDWVYPATGLAATTLVATHALVDFSLQIPAVALTFSAILGAACAQSHSTRGGFRG